MLPVHCGAVIFRSQDGDDVSLNNWKLLLTIQDTPHTQNHD